MDTNAAQFARLGNPWITAREQQELGEIPTNRKTARANRRPRPFDPNFVDPARVGRAMTPAEEKQIAQRKMLEHIRRLDKQAKGQTVREVTGYAPTRQALTHLKTRDELKLDPMSPEFFRAESTRLARDHDMARRDADALNASHADKQMAKALAAYAKKMAKALDA